MEKRRPLIIYATWDDDASVWVATSEDVPGLATEAGSLDLLVEKLKRMIPELLDANGHADGDDEVSFRIHSELTAVTYRHTA